MSLLHGHIPGLPDAESGQVDPDCRCVVDIAGASGRNMGLDCRCEADMESN